MEASSALLAICAGNSPVTGKFHAQRLVTRSSNDVFCEMHLNKRLSKQSWGWWFETPSHPLSRHCNVYMQWKFIYMTSKCIYIWRHCICNENLRFYGFSLGMFARSRMPSLLEYNAIDSTFSSCNVTSLTLGQCTLARLVYTGMPLECHWLTHCTLEYHWATQRIFAGYTGTPLEKLSWNSPTLECHWRNLVENATHWDTTGESLTFAAYTGTLLAPLLSNRISVIHGSRINYETICCPQFCTYSYQILCHVGGTSPPTWHKIW